MMNLLHGNSLDTLFVVKDTVSRRASSADPGGTNRDFITILPSETATILQVNGAGIIRHIWCTLSCHGDSPLTSHVLRMYWDGEEHPSVEVPLGDFFGIGGGIQRNFQSEPLQMCPQDGRAFNCFFPMPFEKGARITVENETEEQAKFYFYIDYEEMDSMPSGYARFHAQWRRAAVSGGRNRRTGDALPDRGPQAGTGRPEKWPKAWDLVNITGEENYVILEAEGQGHYVGCSLNIVNFEKQVNDWYGEGDDMIFIDGDVLPTLSGTGTEDYFNTAYCPKQEYSGPYSGLTVYSGDRYGRPWAGQNSMYRFHIKDPIRFKKSIRVTIETGHANKLANDYSSTAYWYQLEPHKVTAKLPPASLRKPRQDIK